MALDITDTTNLTKPVNAIFEQTLLRNAQVRCPYFIGSTPGSIQRNGGTNTIKWRRIENLTATTTALAELTTVASYMQGRTPVQPTLTDYTATLAKYGNFIVLNEEVDIFNYSGQQDKLFQIIGINAGQSLNQLQRNVMEDNLTILRVGGAGSDGAIASKITKASIQNVVNTLDKNSAMTFMPMSMGSGNVGTTPMLPAFWGLTHPDVAIDISEMAGFKSVETYAGQLQTAVGEFGALTVAGQAVRFISSEDSSVEADTGAAIGTTGLNGSTNVDVYNTCIFGMDAIGSVGLGQQFGDGIYRAGDNLGTIEVIYNEIGSGGSSDPFKEIGTLAWKTWHAGAVTNANWGRVIRSGATAIGT